MHYVVVEDWTVFGQGLLRLGNIGLSRPNLEFVSFLYTVVEVVVDVVVVVEVVVVSVVVDVVVVVEVVVVVDVYVDTYIHYVICRPPVICFKNYFSFQTKIILSVYVWYWSFCHPHTTIYFCQFYHLHLERKGCHWLKN